MRDISNRYYVSLTSKDISLWGMKGGQWRSNLYYISCDLTYKNSDISPKPLITGSDWSYVTLTSKDIRGYLRSVEITNGQTLTTASKDAIFYICTHMTDIRNIGCVSLTLEVIRGHQKPNLDAIFCKYNYITTRSNIGYVSLTSNIIRSH